MPQPKNGTFCWREVVGRAEHDGHDRDDREHLVGDHDATRLPGRLVVGSNLSSARRRSLILRPKRLSLAFLTVESGPWAPFTAPRSVGLSASPRRWVVELVTPFVVWLGTRGGGTRRRVKPAISAVMATRDQTLLRFTIVPLECRCFRVPVVGAVAEVPGRVTCGFSWIALGARSRDHLPSSSTTMVSHRSITKPVVLDQDHRARGRQPAGLLHQSFGFTLVRPPRSVRRAGAARGESTITRASSTGGLAEPIRPIPPVRAQRGQTRTARGPRRCDHDARARVARRDGTATRSA